MEDDAVARPVDGQVRHQDVPVERDALGYWWHPAVDWDSIPDEVGSTPYLNSMGFDAAFVTMETEAPDLADAYFESSLPAFLAWTPRHPGGNDWFLGAIYDSDSGPVACWLRSNANSASVDVK